ncbi:MAG: hypothetical protein E6069_09225 [Clostridium perfringens]|uniref:hypothetical protein n=1 Tax=Clostridium sp. TaxID=1506 RepID=UPI00290A7746|nr:hypothetical protein [Clostridium sp.]MDU5544725.1 hypothetical protein [Clostridium perfringens]MDU5695333.1 hypothetical protein [Clostridium sp.]
MSKTVDKVKELLDKENVGKDRYTYTFTCSRKSNEDDIINLIQNVVDEGYQYSKWIKKLLLILANNPEVIDSVWSGKNISRSGDLEEVIKSQNNRIDRLTETISVQNELISKLLRELPSKNYSNSEEFVKYQEKLIEENGGKLPDVGF